MDKASNGHNGIIDEERKESTKAPCVHPMKKKKKRKRLESIFKKPFENAFIGSALIVLTIVCVFGVYHAFHNDELKNFKTNDKSKYDEWLVLPAFTSSMNPWSSQAFYEFVLRKKVADDLIPWKAVSFNACVYEGMLHHKLFAIAS